MPRRSKGARLQLKAARRDKSGKITHQATWIIRDNGRDVSTGCAADEIAVAERKLEDYIASKYTPKRRVRHIDDIPIADVLSIYLDAQLEKLRDRFKVDGECEDTIPAIRKFKKLIGRLNAWWGAKMLGEVNGEACRSYRKKRRNRGGTRRDLEDLRAAIGHHAAEGYHREIVKVPLPEKGEPRDKWLTRSDAAKLIWVCWRYREIPTVPIPLRLLAHLRRWHRIDPEAKHFVEFNGEPVSSVKTAFKSAVRLTGLGPGISPHTLRHTAATWLMQKGADPWQAAGYLGMSLEVLLNTYGHHHPDYLSDAVDKIAMRARSRTKGARILCGFWCGDPAAAR